MLKQIVTLIRGASHDSTEAFMDRNALPLLQQQIRDAGRTVTAARKAVALAMAQEEQEKKQFELLVARIEDLETRTIAAIEQKKTELARESAETIAILEMERDASQEARENFSRGLARLKTNVREAESRLRDLQRGERIANATDRAQRLGNTVPQHGASALSEAEATLARLQQRQEHTDLTAAALTSLDSGEAPARMSEKLAEAGCGTPLKTSADDVLTRLTARAGSDD